MAKVKKSKDSDEELFLKGELFWKWKSADSDVHRIDSDLRLKQSQIEAEIEKNPLLKTLMAEKQGLIQALGTSQQTYNSTIAEIEKTMGISLKTGTIDDQTGRIFLHEPSTPVALAVAVTPEPPPAKPRKSKK